MRASSYSTVTVFARLRGRSTSRPRRRAISCANSCSGTIASSGCRAGSIRGTGTTSSAPAALASVGVGGDREDARPAGADLGDVRAELAVGRRVGRQADDRRAVLDQRDRAVLHLAGGVGVAGHVGDLLQLQGAFERERQAEVAAEEHEEPGVRVATRDPLDGSLAGFDHPLDLRRQRRQPVADLGQALRLEAAAVDRELERQQVRHRDLGDERLRRRDADLLAGPGQQHGVRLAGRLRAGHVGDRQHPGAALAREPHRRQRVRGLAGLGDRDEQVARTEQRVAVAVLAGDLDVDRHPGPGLDHAPAEQAGVVGGAAGGDHDAAHSFEQLRGIAVRSSRSRPGRRPARVASIAAGCSSISLRMNVG